MLPDSGTVSIGLLNLGPVELSGAFEAYDESGKLLGESKEVVIPANGSQNFELAALFKDKSPAYLVFQGEGDDVAVTGYCRILDEKGGAAAYPARNYPLGGTQDLYIPRIQATDGWTTEVCLISLSRKKMKAQVHLNDGQTMELGLSSAYGLQRIMIDDTQATAGRVELSHIFYNPKDLVVGAVLYRHNGRLMAAAGLNSWTGESLTVPYLVDQSGWWSSLTCYNPADDGSGSDCEIKSIARIEGRNAELTDDKLELNEEESRDFWEFPAGSYALEIENPCGLTGIGFLGLGDAALGSYTLPRKAGNSGVFAPVSISSRERWSGMVLYNSDGNSAKIEFQAYDDGGKLLAKTVKTVAGHQNLEALPETLFPETLPGISHVRYSSTGGEVFGLLLNFEVEKENSRIDVLPALVEMTE